jgi:ABC-type thiamin/hydroxymethylpyrimidine transport system permease subunit
MLLLGIWLFLAGIGALTPRPGPGIVTGFIALLAGILILIGR